VRGQRLRLVGSPRLAGVAFACALGWSAVEAKSGARRDAAELPAARQNCLRSCGSVRCPHASYAQSPGSR